MSFIEYIKKKGIKNLTRTVFKYKIDVVIKKIIILFTKHKPLLDCIIIESHNDFDCNGGAFYNYLIDNNFNKKYKIIWLVKNDTPKDLPLNVKTFSLFRPSIKKDYYICRAKVMLADCDITPKERDDQISVFCTHGGISIKNTRGYLFVPDYIDYILSPSHNFDKILCDKYSLSYDDQRIIHIGYPYNDIYFENTRGELNKITSKKYNKTILWMPTFRKNASRNDSKAQLTYGIPIIENADDFFELNEELCKYNILLIIKYHPMQDLNVIKRIPELTNIIGLDKYDMKRKHLDNYRLMAEVDALLSDYSASSYSYILLNRPIGFVLADLKDYKAGLVVDNPDDYMPGEKIYTKDQLFRFIYDVNENNDIYKNERENLCDYLYEYRDGKTCERLSMLLNLKNC